MKLVVIGAGRMGHALAEAIERSGDCTLLACLERSDALPRADAYIDFSHPANLPRVCQAAAEGRIPLVLGTTGLTDGDQQRVRHAAQQTAIVQAANFSTGIAILTRLLAEMRSVRHRFDVEIVEAHHRWKLDVPSGTALALAQALCPASEEAAQLPIHALRGGTLAGDHTVLFLGEDEVIELRHHAGGRQIFAQGALLAVRYALQQPPGLYTMENVLWDH